MSGFTIGEIKDVNGNPRTSVSIVDAGVQLFNYEPGSFFGLGGGLGTYTPAEALQLGQLLINAADRWAELNAHIKQAEYEVAAVNDRVKNRIRDFLT